MLLKEFQSAAARQPKVDPFAVLQAMEGWVEPIVYEVPPLVTVMPTPLAMDEVATDPNFAGVPEVVVQYGIWPAVSDDEVATACVLPVPEPQAVPVLFNFPVEVNWAQPTPASAPIVKKPFASIAKALADEVAKVVGDEVAM